MTGKRIVVTGGAGFIGSNFVELALDQNCQIVVLDSLTYAGDLKNLEDLKGDWRFVKGDIRDAQVVASILAEFKPHAVLNFAAESHVDRSIENPSSFVETNVLGVLNMLATSKNYWETLSTEERVDFRFLQVSTDEVFGSLGDTGFFSETTPYAPNSPYSASKAGGDHLARAWFHTYKFPVLITNCSNNYGPKQYPEKLIPYMIQCALRGDALPVYGNGRNIRDWIHVQDHCRGIMAALENGCIGESYCFGGNSERANIDVVRQICAELDVQSPSATGKSYAEQISFVTDRKGHDWRYAIDDTKARVELGYVREYGVFEQGLKQTVAWYLERT